MSFDKIYVAFRGSNAFFYALIASIWAAIIAHRFFGFDPDWGITNLSLSIEASVGMAFLIRDGAKKDALLNKQLEYILHLLEAEAAREADRLANRPGVAVGGDAAPAANVA